MDLIAHISLFIAGALILWFFSGLLIEAVDKVARRFNKSGFVVAFFMLGFLTSISELSVAINSVITGVPQVSVGNLVGASFVILLMIVPALAIMGNGVSIENTLSRKNFIIALSVIVLPALLVIDNNVSIVEGGIVFIAYLTLLYAIRNDDVSVRKVEKIAEDVIEDISDRKRDLIAIGKVILGAVAIFYAGNILVKEAVFFAGAFGLSKSLMGLILLSLGTNIPELVIAARAIAKGKKDIAFGNYLGSTVTNSAIFGLLALFAGPFILTSRELAPTAILLFVGLIVLYVFARSKYTISRREGYVLIMFYGLFVAIQTYMIALIVGA